MHAPVGILLRINQHTKCEVLSFTYSTYMIGAKFLKKRVTWLWPCPLGGLSSQE